VSNMKRTHKKQGFTSIELLVVIAIAGVLTTLLLWGHFVYTYMGLPG
jgi:prepilin-type N-terminal cleavage/methylation domain-containing protein